MKTMTNGKPYGKELIIDLHECDVKYFNKMSLDKFFRELADLTNMELCARHWWTMDDCPPEWKDVPHLNGISAVHQHIQFYYSYTHRFEGGLSKCFHLQGLRRKEGSPFCKGIF